MEQADISSISKIARRTSSTHSGDSQQPTQVAHAGAETAAIFRHESVGGPTNDAMPAPQATGLGAQRQRTAGDANPELPSRLHACPLPPPTCKYLLLSLFSGMGGAEHLWRESQFSPEARLGESFCISFETSGDARWLHKGHFVGPGWALSSAAGSHGLIGGVGALTEEDGILLETIFRAAPHLEMVLIIGGPPCQDFSVAGYQRGFSGPRGQMTVVTADALARAKRLLSQAAPRAALAFAFENVASMERHIRDAISRVLGCAPRICNVATSGGATQRQRFVWTNFAWTPDAKPFSKESFEGVLHKAWVPALQHWPDLDPTRSEREGSPPFGCFTTSWPPGRPQECAELSFGRLSLVCYGLAHLVVRPTGDPARLAYARRLLDRLLHVRTARGAKSIRFSGFRPVQASQATCTLDPHTRGRLGPAPP